MVHGWIDEAEPHGRMAVSMAALDENRTENQPMEANECKRTFTLELKQIESNTTGVEQQNCKKKKKEKKKEKNLTV